MPDLHTVEVLLAVVRNGSLNAAAAELGLTQQAISARMSSLEAQVGVQLLVRSARGTTLTDAGRLVVQWAERLMQVAEEVDAGLAALRGDRRTRLRVSASLTIAEQLLPGWLVSMQTAARQRGQEPLEVVLTAANSREVVEHVLGSQADIGFVEGPTVPGPVQSRVISTDMLLVVAPPGHPWTRRPRPVSAVELANTPLVSRESGSGTRLAYESALRDVLGDDVEFAPPALELSTASAVRRAVMAGAAPAVMSELAVGEDLNAGRLQAVEVDGVDLHRELRAIWVGSRTPPAGAGRDLLSHIAAVSSSAAIRRRVRATAPRSGTRHA